MSDVLIEAQGLGKQYHRGYFQKRGRDRGSDQFWALQDVDLELCQGEALGIIGPNGAGKSTLLKILSRVTTPTEGWLKVRGRVGALIELGAGFHPELSGRDNVYISGSILGMSRREIARRFEEIVAFAEIEEFIDMPVKKYSSGMYVRLGFAVAAHMDPEILLVDEVLAVGDGSFQKKCFGAMERFREQGASIILVSHSLYNISRNCARGMLLLEGRTSFLGTAEEAIAAYQSALAERERQSGLQGALDVAEHLCSKDLEITRVQMLDPRGGAVSALESGAPLRVVLDYAVRRPCPAFHAEVVILDWDGNTLAVNHTYLEHAPFLVTAETGRVECAWPTVPLTSGSYVLQVALYDETGRVRQDIWQGVYRQELGFTIPPNDKSIYLERWRGVVELECQWLAGPLDAAAAADLPGEGRS